MVVWGGLIVEKRIEAKGKGEKERYTHLNTEFQRIERRDKKEKNNRMGKTRDLIKKIRDTKGTFCASPVQSLSCVDSLRTHGLHHARPPCPSPTPGVYSNSCPLSQWCHSTISSSVVPFSSRLQSFPASGSFPVSQFFALGGQSFGVSASSSVLPMNIQDWFPLGWAGWISLQSKGLSRVLSNTPVQKHQFVITQLSS